MLFWQFFLELSSLNLKGPIGRGRETAQAKPVYPLYSVGKRRYDKGMESPRMKGPRISRNSVKEPNLKCSILRLLVPYALLIDAAVELFTLSQFSGNFNYTLVVKLAMERAKLAEKSRKP